MGCEGDAYGCAWAEEIAEGTGWRAELVEAADGDIAGGGGAESGGVVEIVDRDGEGRDVGDEVGAGIIAVEKIEEFDEGSGGETVVESEGTTDT